MSETALLQSPEILKVLLIDDSPEYKDTIKGSFSSSPYVNHNFVYTIDDPSTTEELANIDISSYDLVLADYYLNNWKVIFPNEKSPDSTGVQVIQRVYDTNAKCKFILYSTNRDALEQLQTNMSDTLTGRLIFRNKSALSDPSNSESLTNVLIDESSKAIAQEGITPPHQPMLSERLVVKCFLHSYSLSALRRDSEMASLISHVLLNYATEEPFWLIGDHKFVIAESEENPEELYLSVMRLHFLDNNDIPFKIELEYREETFVGGKYEKKNKSISYPIANSHTICTEEDSYRQRDVNSQLVIHLFNANWLLGHYIKNIMNLNDIINILDGCSEETRLFFCFGYNEYSVLTKGFTFEWVHESITTLSGMEFPELLNIFYCQVDYIDDINNIEDGTASVVMHSILDITNPMISSMAYSDLRENGVLYNKSCFKLIVFRNSFASKCFRWELIQFQTYETIINSNSQC